MSKKSWVIAVARRARSTPPGLICHVLNRGVGRQTLFHKQEDYAAFERVPAEVHRRTPVRILGHCRLHRSIARNRPFGDDAWTARTARRHGLESALGDPWRPRSARMAQEAKR